MPDEDGTAITDAMTSMVGEGGGTYKTPKSSRESSDAAPSRRTAAASGGINVKAHQTLACRTSCTPRRIPQLEQEMQDLWNMRFCRCSYVTFDAGQLNSTMEHEESKTTLRKLNNPLLFF
jgi:hypothetical protein